MVIDFWSGALGRHLIKPNKTVVTRTELNSLTMKKFDNTAISVYSLISVLIGNEYRVVKNTSILQNSAPLEVFVSLLNEFRSYI